MPYEKSYDGSNKSSDQTTASTIEEAIMSTIQKFNLQKQGHKNSFEQRNKSDVNDLVNKNKRAINTTDRNIESIDSMDDWKPSGILANISTQKSQRFIEDFFNDVIRILNVDVSVTVKFTGTSFMVSLTGNDAGAFIGNHGAVLYAYQHIINLLLKEHNAPKVFLNASNYREERRESLARYALNCAKKVLRTRVKFVFEPMNAYDRLVIYEALRNFDGISVRTEGKDDSRYLSIELDSDKKN